MAIMEVLIRLTALSCFEPREGQMAQVLVTAGYYHDDLVGNMSVGVEITSVQKNMKGTYGERC
jgi:hypothetical protein